MRSSLRITVLIVFAAALVGHAAPGAAQTSALRAATPAPPAQFDTVRSHIQRLLDSAQAPSLAVAVAQHGKIIWEEGFGWADIEGHRRATANTLYSMASISKPITATGFMTLVERHAVNLSHPANDYLGAGKITGLAGSAADATVERVMSHTAGLPLHYRFFYEGGTEKRPTMDEAISRYGIVVYPPGRVYNYSNLGFGIVEQMMARVSKHPYEAYMRSAVFAPLGMNRTAIGTGRGLVDAAIRYDANEKPIAFYDFDHRGASAVWTTAHELVRFGMFHLLDRLPGQKRVLSDSTILDMHRLRTPGDTANGYALGWAINEDHGYRRVSHTGGMPGVATVLNLYPAQDVAIVVLGNQSNGLPGRVAREIAAAVLPGYGAALANDVERGQARPPEPFTAPSELRGEWSGAVRTYQGQLTIALRVRSDEILVRLGGDDALWTLLNNPSWQNDLLGGQFVGTIPTDDARRHPHVVRVSLWLGDGKLRGWAAAIATTDPIAGAISSYAELTQSAADPRANTRSMRGQ